MTSWFTILFFNISGGEIFIILLIVFLVFGPSKIPEIARSLGRMMNEVKKASSDISREFRKETSSIERAIDKSTEDLSDNFKGLENDPVPRTKTASPEPEGSEIPEAYLKSSDQEAKLPEKEKDEPDQKREKPIQ